MRWLLALAVACTAAGCRRAQPPVQPAPPAFRLAQGEPPRERAEREPAAARAAASLPASPRDIETLPVIDLPPPIIAQAQAKKPEEEHDNRLYSWVDEQGTLHYGGVDEIPDSRLRSARVVDDAGVTVVSGPTLDGPAPQAASAPAPAQDATQASDPKARGPEPERDAQGLPIPGTMEDTGATRAAKAAGETQLDPAAVQRRHEEELRRMNCKLKDGVWVCG